MRTFLRLCVFAIVVTQAMAADIPVDTRSVASIDPQVLEKHVGYYQRGDQAYFSVAVMNDHLETLMRGSGGAVPVDMFPENDRVFLRKLTSQKITFELSQEGDSVAVVLSNGKEDVRMPRIDKSTADRIEKRISEALAARVTSNQPSPGSEDLLRRHVEYLTRGEPLLDEMTPGLAEGMRQAVPKLLDVFRTWGAIKAVEFKGVASDGWDIYLIQFANSQTEWRIAPLPEDGILAGLAMKLPTQ